MAPPQPAVSRAPAWLTIGVLGAVVTLVGLDLMPILFIGDVGRYHEIATGPTFWLGQEVEFPPVTALFIWIGARWGDNSLGIVMALNLGLHLATAAVLLRGWGTRAVDTYLLLTLPLLPLTLFRVDHLAVLFAVSGMAAARRDRDGRSAALLAVGVLAKLWPAALLAGLPRARLRLVAMTSATVVVLGGSWVAAFGTGALRQVLTFRGSSGWQVESLPGSMLRLFTGGLPFWEGGAWRVGDPPVVATGFLVVLGVVVVLAARRIHEVERRALALVTGVLVTTPLLSPQFLLWICPFVAMLRKGPVRRQAAQVTGLALVLSMVLSAYYGPLLDGDPLALGTLLLRNLLLVVVLLLALLSKEPDVPPSLPAPVADTAPAPPRDQHAHG